MLGNENGHIPQDELYICETSMLERRLENFRIGRPNAAPGKDRTYYDRHILSIERELVRRKEAEKTIRGLSLGALNSRLSRLRELEEKYAGFSRARTWWIEQYEKEIDRREVYHATGPWFRFNQYTDDDLAFWDRYYTRKIDETDDPGWKKKWEQSRKDIQHEISLREQADRSLRGEYITYAHVKPTVPVGTPVYAGEASDPNRKLIGKVLSSESTLSGVSVSLEMSTPIDHYFLKELSMNLDTPSYPLTRSLLRNNRYNVVFNGSNVELTAPENQFDLAKLSDELRQLDVNHRIEVYSRKALKADLSSDAFKRLLGKLL